MLEKEKVEKKVRMCICVRVSFQPVAPLCPTAQDFQAPSDSSCLTLQIYYYTPPPVRPSKSSSETQTHMKQAVFNNTVIKPYNIYLWLTVISTCTNRFFN